MQGTLWTYLLITPGPKTLTTIMAGGYKCRGSYLQPNGPADTGVGVVDPTNQYGVG